MSNKKRTPMDKIRYILPLGLVSTMFVVGFYITLAALYRYITSSGQTYSPRSIFDFERWPNHFISDVTMVSLTMVFLGVLLTIGQVANMAHDRIKLQAE
tara:strand:- start:1961 stop:2257 length:297 start_codon:yes stop_codon:yes gene_type:complete